MDGSGNIFFSRLDWWSIFRWLRRMAWMFGSALEYVITNGTLSFSFLSLYCRRSSGRGVQHYVIKFVSDLRPVGGFLLVLRFPPPIKHHQTNKQYIINDIYSVGRCNMFSPIYKWQMAHWSLCNKQSLHRVILPYYYKNVYFNNYKYTLNI